MLVEELLELLVDVVDTDLLKTVVVKYFKSSNIKDTCNVIIKSIIIIFMM